MEGSYGTERSDSLRSAVARLIDDEHTLVPLAELAAMIQIVLAADWWIIKTKHNAALQ